MASSHLGGDETMKLLPLTLGFWLVFYPGDRQSLKESFEILVLAQAVVSQVEKQKQAQ